MINPGVSVATVLSILRGQLQGNQEGIWTKSKARRSGTLVRQASRLLCIRYG